MIPQRQHFTIATDTGTQGDTGPCFMGAIEQVRWKRQSGDTGGALALTLLPREGDTGDGMTVLSCGLTPDLLKAAWPPAHGPDGLDTGVATFSCRLRHLP